MAWFYRHISAVTIDGVALVTNTLSYAIRGFQSVNPQTYVWWYLIGVLALGGITILCLL